MGDYRPLSGTSAPVDLPHVAALVATARQDTSAGLVAREMLLPAVADMVAEIGRLRDAVTAYSEDLEDMRAEMKLARSARLTPVAVRRLVDKRVHTPRRVRAYLLAHGWTCTTEWHDSSAWGHPLRDGEVTMHWEVRVLDSDRSRDYGRRVAELVETVADCEGTGELGVLADIAEAGDA